MTPRGFGDSALDMQGSAPLRNGESGQHVDGVAEAAAELHGQQCGPARSKEDLKIHQLHAPGDRIHADTAWSDCGETRGDDELRHGRAHAGAAAGRSQSGGGAAGAAVGVETATDDAAHLAAWHSNAVP